MTDYKEMLDIKLKLEDLQDSENIAELIKDEEQLNRIGYIVKSAYEADKSSRQRWEDKMKDAVKLALQVVEPKSTPWEGAANVKFPLITIAAMQFAARAYPALVKAPDLVKFRVQGADEDGKKASRASRVSAHMSYQLLEEDESWEEDQDKALLALPILGCVFKKSFYDKNEGHNKSPLVLPKDLVVHYYAKTIEKCERKTEVFQLSPREIKERQLRGIFSDVELLNAPLPEPSESDKRQGIDAPFDDADGARTLLEQHRFLDLDGDGYKEPYIVTIDKSTSKVLRIVARFDKIVTKQSIKIEELQKRVKALAEGLPQKPQSPQDEAMIQQALRTAQGIEKQIEMLAAQKPKVVQIVPVEHYTKYSFIPSPDGGFYDLGFGALLGPLNASVNTLINQMIDAGSLSNSSSGFIGRGARIKGGKTKFSLNEWKRVSVSGGTLRDNIVPLPVNPPSAELFNLLSLLISYSERVGSVTDTMTGENPGQNTPAYNMSAMLEQGMQVFNGVFKRVYRSMRSEFRKLYRLNGIYLDQEAYFAYQDSDTQVLRTDYTADAKDLIPAADPNAFSNKEKLDKAAIILQRADQAPGYDPIEKEKRWLSAMDIPDIDKLFPMVPEKDEQGQETGNMVLKFPPQPDPELEIKKADMQRRTLEGQSKAEKESILAESTVLLNKAKVFEMMARMEDMKESQEYKRLELIVKEFDIQTKAIAQLAKIEEDGRNARSNAGDKKTSS